MMSSLSEEEELQLLDEINASSTPYELISDDNHELTELIEKRDRMNNNARIGFITLLMNNTPFSYNICKNIYSYLPYQSQFICLNPIFYHGWYSLFELLLYIITNTAHYTIRLFFINSSMTPFIVFAGLESLIIVLFYLYFNGNIKYNIDIINDIEDQYCLFYDELHLILEFFINIPMMIMLLFFSNKYYNTTSQYIAVSLFFICYFIPILYQFLYYKLKWHRRRNNGTHGFKNIYLFVPIPSLLLFLYFIMENSWISLICSVFLFLFGIIFINWVHITTSAIYLYQENVLMTSKMSLSNFILLCIHLLVFGYFGVELYGNNVIGKNNDNINYFIAILSFLFVVIEAFIIFLFYVIFNFVGCQLYDHPYSIYTEYQVIDMVFDYDSDSKFAKFHSYLYIVIDSIITIPMAILLLYYMYNNNYYYIAWYLAIAIYILFDIWKFGVIVFYYKDFDLDRSMTHIIMFFIKLPLILFIFALTEICINYYNYNTKIMSIMSTVFVTATSIYFCCILPLCIARCIGKI